MLPATFFFALPADHLLVRGLLGLHIAAGSTALLAGLVPMLGRKGGRWHVRAGRLYTACMVLVAASAVALCAVQPLTFSRLFLAGVAVLSFYLSFSGWRAARRRTTLLPAPDKVLAACSLLIGLGMVGTGVVLGAVLFAFFGGLLSLFAGLDTWQALRPRPVGIPTPWLLRHVTRMGGSYISATTAFVVVNLGGWLPESAPAWSGLAGWLAPTIVGSLLIRRAVRRYCTPGGRRISAPMLPVLLALLFPALAAAQTPAQVRGHITDAAGKPLPYATVGVVGQAVGTVADAQGQFHLALPASVAPTDTLRFALVGYSSRSWAVRQLPASPLTVQLSEAPLALPTVLVRARGRDTVRIGNPRYRTRMQTNFALGREPGLNVGSEIGRVFQIPRGGAWLEQFEFVVSANTFDTVQLRINVYRLRNGVPAEPLLRHPLYRQLTSPGAARVRVDLRPENLFVQEDVAVTVEWVSHSRRGSRLALPILMPAFATHLYRYGAANTWKRFPSMSTAMELVVVK